MRLRLEPFDPEQAGYDALSEFLSEFYEGPPWNEYLKCVSCSSFSDFGPRATFGRAEAKARGLTRCPDCGGDLVPFWSADRVREYFSQMQAKGRLSGITLYDGDTLAGWLWGYHMPEEEGSSYGEGAGMYVDVICIPPAYRNGIVAWYLILTTLRHLLDAGYSYVVSRTHVEAENVRVLFRRLGFEELAAGESDPQRTYWWRRLDSISAETLRANYEALARASARGSAPH